MTVSVFLDTSPAIPSVLRIEGNILIIALSTLEIIVYDLTALPVNCNHLFDLFSFSESNTFFLFFLILQATDGPALLASAQLIMRYKDSQDCCSIVSMEYHPYSRKLIFASELKITTIELGICIDDSNNCLSCGLTAYFSYDSSFSLLKQKQTRSEWHTINEDTFFENPKFLDTGKGTAVDPYLNEMSIC